MVKKSIKINFFWVSDELDKSISRDRHQSTIVQIYSGTKEKQHKTKEPMQSIDF